MKAKLGFLWKYVILKKTDILKMALMYEGLESFGCKKGIVGLLISVISINCFLATAQQSPRTYTVLKANELLKIDGRALEASWKDAGWSEDFIDIEGVKTPLYRTRMKMLWNEDYLYFFAKIEEPHVWGTLKQRDTVIFYNNDFEIFIDPDGDTHDYMEFEMNVLNTIWDLWLTKPYRNGAKVIDGWDIHGLKTAVHIDGTLNDPNDKDAGWSVEIAMPWKAILEAAKDNRIPVNEFWRLNFSRVNWEYELENGRYSRKKDESGKYLPEYNWVWSPQGVINMHEPEHWGYVYFSNESATHVNFTISSDEKIKWHLYTLAHRLWSAEKNRSTKPKKADLQKSFNISDIEVFPLFEEHTTGWNLSVMSPFSNKRLTVREDGKFISYDE
ncbi:carbohydrate-binding family 9-like protein [Maribacter algicola]|uniref:Carbohydrate-binding family 9-like protein n=1 Tax=Meishania litoralis TaxID=3434685 RepID=A0ACC7LG05_9FLAO